MLTSDLAPELSQVLKAHHVQVTQPRDWMVQLSAVPAGAGFSKPCTNVLLRQRSGGGAWEAYVDDDLAYSGGSTERDRLFSGPRLHRWLRLNPPEPLHGSVNEAILRVLDWLDSPLSGQVPPALRQQQRPLAPVLERFGRLLAPEEAEALEPTGSQAEAIERAAGTVTRSATPACPLLVGPAGCGKTTAARRAARALLQRGVVRQVLEMSGAAVSCGTIFLPQRDEQMQRVMEALLVQKETLVVLEQFDLVLARSKIAAALLADALDRGLKLIAVAGPGFSPKTIDGDGPLARRLEVVTVEESGPEETMAILRRRLRQHPLAKQVELAPEGLAAVRALARRRPGANPGAALGLLEAVLAHTAWAGQKCAGPDDVYYLVREEEE